MRYPSEIHLKLKPREISFAHNSCFSWPIALKFCTDHDSITAVLCAQFQTDWTIETAVVDERDFARFGFFARFREFPMLHSTLECFFLWITTIMAMTLLGYRTPSKPPWKYQPWQMTNGRKEVFPFRSFESLWFYNIYFNILSAENVCDNKSTNMQGMKLT